MMKRWILLSEYWLAGETLSSIGMRMMCMIATACMLVILLLGCNVESDHLPPMDGSGFYSLPEADFIYNEPDSVGIVEFVLPEGYFQEELDDEELVNLVPDGRYPCTGSASWDGTGKLLSVFVDVEVDGNVVSVEFPVNASLDNMIIRCRDPVVSRCNGVEFAVLESIGSSSLSPVRFVASGKAGAQSVYISHSCRKEDAEQARAAFEKVIRWISIRNGMGLDASSVKYSKLPEFFSLELTESEARSEENFGHLMPKQLTYILDNHATKNFHRYKDKDEDYLLGNWSCASTLLEWKVCMYTEEDHQHLVTGDALENASNADFHSVYSYEDISVELFEAIETGDSDIKMIYVNVKCGDYVISIRARHIDAETLYTIINSV